MYAQTLVLDRAYRPHKVVDWKEAVIKMFGGKVEVICQYDEVLTVIGRNHLSTFPELKRALRQVIGTDAESITIHVPAVVVLRKRLRSFKAGVKFSKINVCLRDSFSCQYCGTQLPMSRLEYEHVVPRDQGGKTVWENIVMACTACNSRKGNRTPEEAGMALLSVPRKPRTLPLSGPRIQFEGAPVEWEPFLQTVA